MSTLRLSSPAPASTGTRRAARSAPRMSDPPPSRESVAPSSGRPAPSSAPLDYTDEQEETRVRQTSGRSSEAPESAASEELQETDSFPIEVESSPDSMLSRYFRDMATHQVMGPDEELVAVLR